MIALLCMLLLKTSNIEAKVPPQSLIVSRLSGGRLGDNLLSISHAAWFACKNNLLLGYYPFDMCKKFSFSRECLAIKKNTAYYPKTICIPERDNAIKETKFEPQGILYELPYYPDFEAEYHDGSTYKMPHSCVPYVINWYDQEFIAYLRHLLSPIKPIPVPTLPADRICIALHVRRGGGYDPANANKILPYKHVPVSFFIEQLIYLHNELGRVPVYAYIFTDDQKPQSLIKYMSKYLAGRDIVLDYRKAGNRHDANVVEDFVFMQKFPYIIRPQSNYSYIAAKLGGAIIEIEPAAFKWNQNYNLITHARIIYSDGSEFIRPCSPDLYM